MKDFRFEGPIEASKSLLNRWLIVASWAPAPLTIRGDSTCDDVLKMRRALADFGRGIRELDVGEAGAVLRFLAFRVSREKGEFRLTGSRRLFERPQGPLIDALAQLGVQAELETGALRIRSDGWKNPGKALIVDRALSSQFISGVLLNAFGLDYPLFIEAAGLPVSDSYWKMSRRVALKAGLKLSGSGASLEILRHQKVRLTDVEAEPDYSSVFAVAGLAAVGGEATISNARAEHAQDPLQPDARGLEVLARMGAAVEWTKGRYDSKTKTIPERLVVRRAAQLKGADVDLSDAPDLFPVLAAVAACAQGRSVLSGAPHLRHKESDRIAEVERLLGLCGVRYESREDGLVIEGAGLPPPGGVAKDFDPAGDHRLVMAAAVLRQAGHPLNILHAEVCAKSFPAFPGIAGL